MKLAQREGMLVTYALGSCIGICLYDPAIKLGGLLHIMLPLNMEAGRKTPLKYADTGFAEMLRQMELKGAKRARMTAKIAGGAKMFEVGGNSSLGNIGQRNIAAVKQALATLRIPIIADDTGKNYGRTLYLTAEDGVMRIKSVNRGEWTY